MNYQEAKIYHEEHPTAKIYAARYDGEIWNAGGMVEVGEVLGYYLTEDDAQRACKDYELFDFDAKHLSTSVELCDDSEFDD